MLQEGQEILEGRFKIIKKLGSGAFGEIFKGIVITLLTFCSRKEKDRGIFCCQNSKCLLTDPSF
jgi:hypothetical protein